MKFRRSQLFLALLFLLADLAYCMTYIKPGDTGSIVLPVKNIAESVGDMENAEIEVTCDLPPENWAKLNFRTLIICGILLLNKSEELNWYSLLLRNSY